MKKSIIFIILITSCIEFLQASEQFQGFTIGQELTVYAPSGLSLRTSPNTYGQVIEVVEYGETVRLIQNQDFVHKKDKMNWVEGSWVLVEYEGQEGYVFDGYLSDLPMPSLDFELNFMDMELIFPLEAWVEYRLKPEGQPDTTIRENGPIKIVYRFDNNQRMILQDHEGYFKLQLYLSDIRIMDSYHLLMAMLPGKEERQIFMNQSIFIEGREGELAQVKIKLDSPIDIKKMKNGQVRLSMFTSLMGCSL